MQEQFHLETNHHHHHFRRSSSSNNDDDDDDKWAILKFHVPAASACQSKPTQFDQWQEEPLTPRCFTSKSNIAATSPKLSLSPRRSNIKTHCLPTAGREVSSNQPTTHDHIHSLTICIHHNSVGSWPIPMAVRTPPLPIPPPQQRKSATQEVQKRLQVDTRRGVLVSPPARPTLPWPPLRPLLLQVLLRPFCLQAGRPAARSVSVVLPPPPPSQGAAVICNRGVSWCCWIARLLACLLPRGV